MSRSSTEIFKDLRSAMAELEHALKAEGKATDEEISPLLKQALAQPLLSSEPQAAYNERMSRYAASNPQQLAEAERDSLDRAHEARWADPRPLPRQEKPERLQDYVPSDNVEGFDEAVFMGTGDRRVE